MQRRSFLNALLALPGLAGMTFCVKRSQPKRRVRVFEFLDGEGTMIAADDVIDAIRCYWREIFLTEDLDRDVLREVTEQELASEMFYDDDGEELRTLQAELDRRLEFIGLPFVLCRNID